MSADFNKIEKIAMRDIAQLQRAEKSYGDSWRKRGGVGAIGTAGYLAGQKKTASARIHDFAVDRANEFIEFGKEAGYDGSLIDDLALEILDDNGYDLSPLY